MTNRIRRFDRERMTHFVYEFWDNDICLYVGCTRQPAGRISAHASKPWWPNVTRIVANAYLGCTRGYAEEQERITTLRPAYNLTY